MIHNFTYKVLIVCSATCRTIPQRRQLETQQLAAARPTIRCAKCQAASSVAVQPVHMPIHVQDACLLEQSSLSINCVCLQACSSMHQCMKGTGLRLACLRAVGGAAAAAAQSHCRCSLVPASLMPCKQQPQAAAANCAAGQSGERAVMCCSSCAGEREHDGFVPLQCSTTTSKCHHSPSCVGPARPCARQC